MGSFSKLKTIFNEGEEFLLICHEQPDGDALGSLLALGEALKGNGKKVTLVCKDSVPEVFSFLPGIGKIKKDFLIGDHDAIILLDNGDLRRTGFPERIRTFSKKRIPIVNIDHHPNNDLRKLVSVNYVDETASSSSELVYEIINSLGYKLSPIIATSLLAGIFTDTGGFQHANTSPKVLSVVSELLNSGAKLKLISQNISNSRSIERLKLWGLALDRLVYNPRYKAAISVIMHKDLEKVEASEDEVSGLVNLINSIPESNVAILLYEAADGNIRGSLRTDKENIDLSQLAKIMGGGGHKKAAGFMISGNIIQENGFWKIS